MEKKRLYDIIGILCGLFLLGVLIVSHVQANNAQKLDLPSDAQTLTASADGKVGPVEVEVIASPSEIFKVRVTNHTETDGIGTNAVDQIPGAIVEKQSLAVDAVSGATITSEAIQTAVAKAMTEAGMDPSAFGYAEAAEPEAAAEPAPAAAEPAAAPVALEGLTPGTYTAEAQGLLSPVKVNVTVDESSITAVEVDSSGETPEIGGAAAEELANQVMAAQGAAIDGVAGATMTSEAVRQAVTAALVEAGLVSAAEEPAPAEEAEPAPAAAVEAPADAQTLTGKGQGIDGDVVVQVVADAEKIYSVEVTEQHETVGIGSVAVEKLPAAIVEANTWDVDGVSGATITSTAIRDAVKAALESADFGAAEPAAEVADGAGEPQTLTGVGQGIDGDVVVQVVADAEKIYSVEVTEQHETVGIGSVAVEKLPAAIVEANTWDVDGVSGATITSTAIRDAVKAALESADFGAAEPAAEVADGAGEPQTLTGVGQGIDGDVVVQVVADAEKIYSVEVTEQHETVGIGSVAVEKLPAAIVEANTWDIDGVSGATITSTAIRNAVKTALEEAGFDPAAYTAEAAPAEEAAPAAEAAETVYDVDVVVVGAGGAGMTAAITAADEGKTVLVLESQGMVGGNSVRSTGGMNAAPTEWQQANEFGESAGVEGTLAKVEKYPDNERIQELGAIVAEQWAAYQANPEGYFDSAELFQLDTLIGGGGLNDPALVKKLVESSESAIAWLGQLDPEVVLHNVAQFGGAAVKRIHRPVDADGKVLSVGAYVVPLLQENLEKRGIEVLLSTTATEILTDENGAAVGVAAETADGGKVTVNAASVVIASGGFGANNDMIAEIRPELDGFITTNAPGIQGQGIRMAQAIGADTVDLEQIQLHPTVHVEGTSAVLITEGLRGDGAILVNQEGERFFDEVSTRDKVSAAEFEQTGGYAWLIVDSRMSDASNVIQGYINKGYAETGESYEALAEAIGAPAEAFAATMEKWNACVEAKEDADFGRVAFANPLDQAPYYAIKVQPGIHHTMGGIRINDNAQVISTDGSVIDGLFAAGEVTGGVHGNNRLGGNAVADFVIYGRIAGAGAAGVQLETAAAAEEPAAEAAGGAGEPQTLTGVGQGIDGDVVVQVVADAEKIYSVEVTEQHETVGIGSVAVEKLPAAIVEANTWDVDGVSGATITSTAIRDAVKAALESADFGAAEPAAEAAEGEPAAEPEAAAAVVGIQDDGSDGKTVAHKVETKSGVQVLHAADWEAQYPEIYATYMQNEENDEVVNYLEEYPQLVTLYEPYGFSKSYGSARGHFYDVNDILETGRPHKMAQCWTCKTPDFTNMANEIGPEAYQYDFNEVGNVVTEGISCYNCHANKPGEITVTHTYVIDALGEDFDKVAPANLACGQCHVEYYFYPGTGVTSLPRFDLETMHPDAILDYYNNVLVDENGLGFADYTNPRTGVRQLKVQHPEFETFLGKGSIHAGQFTCADCHMGKTAAEDGTSYANHYLTSPLNNQELIDNTCALCHKDLVSEVKAVQEKADARTREIADQLVDLTEQLAAAVESGNYADEQLDPVRALARDAQFYWDFVFVENSNGAHNPALTAECLDKAEAHCTEALSILQALTAEKAA